MYRRTKFCLDGFARTERLVTQGFQIRYEFVLTERVLTQGVNLPTKRTQTPYLIFNFAVSMTKVIFDCYVLLYVYIRLNICFDYVIC